MSGWGLGGKRGAYGGAGRDWAGGVHWTRHAVCGGRPLKLGPGQVAGRCGERTTASGQHAQAPPGAALQRSDVRMDGSSA